MGLQVVCGLSLVLRALFSKVMRLYFHFLTAYDY